MTLQNPHPALTQANSVVHQPPDHPSKVIGRIRWIFCQMPLIQVVVPQVMNLKPQLTDSSKILDEEDVKTIARLFADMGDSYIELIEIAHPEHDIASMTFNFCHNLQICLIERESYASHGSCRAFINDEEKALEVANLYS
ncbi:hypothetical protein L1987_85660 [Smallanthus sonchifolius]|uniref:Uncharacterized protein n=1 Tax=Smallanthus sonchifolius TaxID=185202 RepID=A0ACB8XXS9_9ASTR|nr:hypothetical protein L1987_85660 [Smallanthus sonchifolius]